MNDQQAIARLKRGSVDGLSALISRYQVQAVRTAYLITQDVALAQDVVQDAFINVYQSIHQFDNQRPFLPWFMRMVVNRAIKTEQRTRSHLSLDDALDKDDSADSYLDQLTDVRPGPDEMIELVEREQAVWEALAKLSPERRAVIILRFYGDYSDNEIAEQLDIPIGTVKSRLHMAKKQLRALIFCAPLYQVEQRP